MLLSFQTSRVILPNSSPELLCGSAADVGEGSYHCRGTEGTPPFILILLHKPNTKVFQLSIFQLSHKSIIPSLSQELMVFSELPPFKSCFTWSLPLLTRKPTRAHHHVGQIQDMDEMVAPCLVPREVKQLKGSSSLPGCIHSTHYK